MSEGLDFSVHLSHSSDKIIEGEKKSLNTHTHIHTHNYDTIISCTQNSPVIKADPALFSRHYRGINKLIMSLSFSSAAREPVNLRVNLEAAM